MTTPSCRAWFAVPHHIEPTLHTGRVAWALGVLCMVTWVHTGHWLACLVLWVLCLVSALCMYVMPLYGALFWARVMRATMARHDNGTNQWHIMGAPRYAVRSVGGIGTSRCGVHTMQKFSKMFGSVHD